MTAGRLPRHVKSYADLRGTIRDSVARYCDEVRQGVFPGPEQTFD
jgi:3-methyl-2-oxobutanoate hydroxymethyltransferase